jgi:SPOR domain
MRQTASHFDEPYDSYELVGEERADEPVARDRRLPAILLTLVAMAVFAGGLWFAYVQGTKQAAAPAAGASGDGVPLLRADERPTKVKPDQPGGMPAPDQNNSLYAEKVPRPSSEKLLPPPEQPMPRPVPPSPPPPREAAAPAAAPAAPPPALEAAAPAPPAAAPAKPTVKTAAVEPKPVAHPKPPATVKPAAAVTPVPAEAAHGGAVQVRLGALRSPEAARDEWARLKRENPDLLGNLRANAVGVDLGDKGIYYRIMAGPFADAAAAERLCRELKQRNRGCILAR